MEKTHKISLQYANFYKIFMQNIDGTFQKLLNQFF